MITYLRVRNLAIVEEFEVEPGPGFNVLTGETGAGKSLLIGSLEFLSGARGSSDSVRSGSDRMTVEAVVAAPRSLAAHLVEMGIDAEADGDNLEVVVRRELAAGGRGRVSVNGTLLTVKELERLMDPLVEIHGQNYSHQRIAGQTFREVLDAWAGNRDLVLRTRLAWRAWKEAADELAQLQSAQKDRALKLDLLRYQIDEISEAQLEPGEAERLRSEREILANAESLLQVTSTSFATLDEDEDSALTRIGRALQQLEPLGRSVDGVRKIVEELEDARYRLEEVTRALSRFADSVRHDPDRLDEIEQRLSTINQFERKYGGSIDAVLVHLVDITRERDQLADFEASAEKLTTVEARQFEAYAELATELSSRRRNASPKFEKDVQKELRDLAMDGTTIKIVLGTHPAQRPSKLQIGGEAVSFGADGFDTVDFLISPNRGEEAKPMARIASGGELSRVQLAIAAALFKRSKGEGTTLVFDEIDQGVGGRVAEVVGRKLKELAQKNQVVCVTHLPQIAGLADTHFKVWKDESGSRTSARVALLSTRAERVEEIARMLGGESITTSARSHAEELISTGSSKK